MKMKALCADPTCNQPARTEFFVPLGFVFLSGDRMRAYYCSAEHRERGRLYLTWRKLVADETADAPDPKD